MNTVSIDLPREGWEWNAEIGAWVSTGGSYGGGSGNPVLIQDAAPTGASEGDLWYCSKSGSEGLYCFDGAYWFETSSNSSGGGDGGSYDDTQITADLATETQARVDGDAALQGQIDGLDLGGAIDEAPVDGKQYARQDTSWSEIVLPEGAPSLLYGSWSYSSSSATSGAFTTRNANWVMATTLTLHKNDISGYEHSFELMTEGDVIVVQAPSGGAEYRVISKTVTGDVCDFVVDAINAFGTFPSNGNSVDFNFVPQTSSGAGMVVSATEPTDPIEGMQWLNSDTAEVFIFDGAVWLEFPAGSGGSGLEEAPEDGKQYARRDASWSEVVIPTVDLTSYATEVYVDNAVAAIPPTDLTSYATEVYVDNAVAAIPPTDLTGYATEVYVNTAIGDISIPPAAPVDSVNGKIGAVVLSAADVGASTFSGAYNDLTGKPAIPTDNNQLTNGKGYTTYSGADAVKTSGAQDVGGIKRFTSELRCNANIIAYYSDIRLKDVQGPIENPVEKVKAIETFYYTHGDKARELGYEGSKIQVGVSAQSVQAVAPELIHRAPIDDDGAGGSVTGESYITVDYPRLVPLLIESIKQLSAEIEELKK